MHSTRCLSTRLRLLRPGLVGLALLLSLLASTDARAREGRDLIVEGISRDQSYAYTPGNPIQLGGIPESLAADRAVLADIQQTFVTLLRGPHGEAVRWRRVGPCCGTGTSGRGPLDIYLVE